MSVTRGDFDPSCYLVIGPGNCTALPGEAPVDAFERVLRAAVDAGFSCIQVRAKDSSARECLDLLARAADVIAQAGASGRVALLMNDRVDVALAARLEGIDVDGVHVGQSDVPPKACRALLGPDAIVGLSAHAPQIARLIEEGAGQADAGAAHAGVTSDASQTTGAGLADLDYFGVGPLHPTASKPDLEKDATGATVTRTLDEIARLASMSPLPLVIGGGVTAADLSALKQTGAAGFFVISAVCGAPDPAAAASRLAHLWRQG